MIGLYKDPHGKKIDSIGAQRLSSQEQLQSSGEAVVEELRHEVSHLKMCLRKYEVREHLKESKRGCIVFPQRCCVEI